MKKLGTLLFEKGWVFLLGMMAIIGLCWPRLFWPLSIGGAAIFGGATALLTGKLPYGGRRRIGVHEGPAAYVGGVMLVAFGVACIVWFGWLQ
jgi:hypothetical protein